MTVFFFWKLEGFALCPQCFEISQWYTLMWFHHPFMLGTWWAFWPGNKSLICAKLFCPWVLPLHFLCSLELPLFRNWTFWSLLKSYVVSYYFYLVFFAWLSGRLPHNFIFQSSELFVSGPHHLAGGILVPQSAIEPMLPEAQSPNLWTAREFPTIAF